MNALDCQQARDRIDALIDGEAGAAESDAFAAHAVACPDCRAALDERRALVAAIRAGGTRFAASDEFRARLLAALPAAEPSAAISRTAVDARPPPRRLPWWSVGAWTGSALALAASITLFVAAPPPQDGLQRDLVGAHVRSLMAGHLIDVESSDRHTVKPWFNGRVDLSPAVPDLADQGFPLAGGRLDYIEERTAAALVYRRDRHLINLFVWPDHGHPDSALALASRNGYAVMTWRGAGIGYAIVSDLNADDLQRFQRLWVSRATGADGKG